METVDCSPKLEDSVTIGTIKFRGMKSSLICYLVREMPSIIITRMGMGIKLQGQKAKPKAKKGRAQCILMMEKNIVEVIHKTSHILLLPSTIYSLI